MVSTCFSARASVSTETAAERSYAYTQMEYIRKETVEPLGHNNCTDPSPIKKAKYVYISVA